MPLEISGENIKKLRACSYSVRKLSNRPVSQKLYKTEADKIPTPLSGQLNQNELFLQIGHFFTSDPSIEHLHNQLISAIYGNVTRDLPEPGVAPWVSANDKPTVLSKPVVGDAAEQRLKTEVMQMPARDRRRLKEVTDGDIPDPLNHSVALSIHDYLSYKQIKLPDSVPASAGGLSKTSA